jgi:hypothetical protein
MKTPKPGQFFWLNGILYRARKRELGCQGCSLNDIRKCPNIIDTRNNLKELDCIENNIILVRV